MVKIAASVVSVRTVLPVALQMDRARANPVTMVGLVSPLVLKIGMVSTVTALVSAPCPTLYHVTR